MRLMRVKGMIKLVTPPVLLNFLLKHMLPNTKNHEIKFKYGFKDWESASNQIGMTYAHQTILERVRDSALKVKSGEYPYERDGFLFNELIPNWQLLSLFYYYLTNSQERSLRVLDFGGGLGTTYYQFKNSFNLQNVKVKWCVVEQPNFVKAGISDFASDELFFENDVESCELEGQFIALLIGVLQYLESPSEYLESIIDSKPEYIFIDATPFSNLDISSISIQIVPKSIYEAGYVAHVFSWNELLPHFQGHYTVLHTWTCADQPDLRNTYRGAIFKRKP